MIECTYGRKFPELVSYFDGNQWIECYSVQRQQLQWKNRKSGEIVDEKPDLSKSKNPKINVLLPTHPFVYSSKLGTWSNCTFENGDEDYFDEITIGPCTRKKSNMQNDLLMLRVAQSQNQRSTIASNKDIRRNLSTATGSVRIMDPNSDPDSPRKSTLNDDPAAVMRSSLLRASLSERDDDIKTKHLSQLGQHFVVKSGTGGALSLPSAKRMSIVSRSRNTMITQGESVDGPMSLAIAATAVDSTQVVIDLTSQFDAQSEVPVINSNLLNVPPPHAPTRASNVIDSQSVQQSNPESEDSNNSSIDASHEQNQSLVPPDENTDFVSTLITSDSAKETVPNSVRRPPGGEISGGLNVDRSGNAGLNATQRNKEFFKKVKEQEETKKKEDEAQRDPAALAAIKENEMIQEQHDKNKTAHYSKLGSTFAVKDMRSTAATRPKKNVA